MTSKRVLAALLIAFCLGCAETHAQRKSDVITLHNGDRITGEIKQLYGGILELSTDTMGTVRIEWREIAQLQSKYYYELRLSQGERLYGSLTEQGKPGEVVLVGASGNQPLNALQVVEIRPVAESFLERFEVYLATTFAYTKASNLRQITLNTSIDYEDEKSVNSLSGRIDVVNSDSNENRSSRLEVARQTWNQNRSNAFRSIYGNFEKNDELDLDYRFGFGAGIGRYFIDKQRMRITGTTGLQLITERAREGGTNQEVEMFLNATLSTWKFTSPELNVDLNLSIFPGVTDMGRLRTDSNLRIRWELIDDLFWDVTSWASSDNLSNEGDGTNWDYAITTGIGWKY